MECRIDINVYDRITEKYLYRIVLNNELGFELLTLCKETYGGVDFYGEYDLDELIANHKYVPPKGLTLDLSLCSFTAEFIDV